jgi:hypothetical protein
MTVKSAAAAVVVDVATSPVFAAFAVAVAGSVSIRL